jgi:uncharacterized protein (DUF433 family)
MEGHLHTAAEAVRCLAEEPTQRRVVTMDPRVEFGRPVLKMSAVPTAVIADRNKAGELIADLVDDSDEDPLNIEEAVRWREGLSLVSSDTANVRGTVPTGS